jgi:asparagine synthetase B (glutamine-hydrolysing)
MDITEAICWLRLLLDQAVKDKKAGGVLLSGGLDTSIVALIAKKYVKRLKAFTVTLEGFNEDLKMVPQEGL